MNLLFEMGLTNAVSTALLAVVVLIVTRIWWNSHIAWGLWFVVLLKLVVPPLVTVPFPEQFALRLSPTQDPGATITHQHPVKEPASKSLPDQVKKTESHNLSTTQVVTRQANEPAVDSSDKISITPISTINEHPAWLTALNWGGWLWLLGSVIWFAIAAIRIWRFHRQVQKAVPASPKLQSLVDSLAIQMKIKHVPQALVFEGQVSPMLWPVGRQLSILLPCDLLSRLDNDQQITLIAHELAHVRRRDYLIRWFELLVLGLYWWNPIAWWARQQLQQAEEQCCDALVVATLPTKTKQYAQTIFETVEFLSASQPLHTPVVSGFMFHFNIHRRLEMIIQSKTKSRLSPVRKLLLVLIGMMLLAVGPMSLLAEPTEEEKQIRESLFKNAVKAQADAERQRQIAKQQLEAAEKRLEEARATQEAAAKAILSASDPKDPTLLDPELLEDLRQLQGKWELYHGNEKKGAPTIRSVKTIKGNRETLRRYNMQGKMYRESSVEFILEKDGDFKILTFYPVGGTPKQGASFLYRIQGDRFFDVPGLFEGKKHRNYLSEPAFWVWHRVKENDQAKTKAPTTDAKAPGPVTPSNEADIVAPKKDAAPSRNHPEPQKPQSKTTNQNQQTALAPSLRFIISIMPGDHLFVGHKHNNKYNHHTLNSLEVHLEKTKPKHVTIAVDVKAKTAFVQRVIKICKKIGVQSFELRKTSDIPNAILKPKDKTSKKPVTLNLPTEGVIMPMIQRERRTIPGSSDTLSVQLGDITGGQVFVEVLNAEGKFLVDRTSLKNNEFLKFDFQGKPVYLQIKDMVNNLIGDDICKVYLSFEEPKAESKKEEP